MLGNTIQYYLRFLEVYFCEKKKRAVVNSSSKLYFYSIEEKTTLKWSQVIRYILMKISALFLWNNAITTHNTDAQVQSQKRSNYI